MLESLPKATAIVGVDRTILDFNSKFLAMVGDVRGCEAVERLASGLHQDKLARLFTSTGLGWRGGELTVNLVARPTLCWCETHSLEDDEALYHLFSILDVEKFHAMEANYLYQTRRVIDDNLWIIDEDGSLIWLQVKDPSYDYFFGRPSRELVAENERHLWDRALAQAKANSGQTHSFSLTSATTGSIFYIEAYYLPDTLMGGRYYVTSRQALPTGSCLLARVKEAWAVSANSDLAARLGVDEADIIGINSESDVPASWLVATGQATGFSVDWLISGRGVKRRI